MQIVIDIPNEIYELCVTDDYFFYNETDTIRQAIKNGVSLPKGHGDIVDADKAFDLLNEEIDKHDKMMAKYQPYSNNQIPLWWWKGICKDLVIIEADKESEEK